MEVQVNSLNEWKKQFPNDAFLLFDDPDFIYLIANSYKKSVQYYSIFEKGEALLSIPIFFNGKDASLTTHFFYQSIIKHRAFNELKFIQIWDLLIKSLKRDFNTIQFKFPPFVFDIRPLQWAGFSHKVYYTSTINLKKDNNYSTNVIRSIKKAQTYHLQVISKEYDDRILEEQLADMIKNGLGQIESYKVRYWVKELSKSYKTRFFEMTDENSKRIASSIYLYDKKQAYLLCIMGGDKNSGGQAFMYDQAIQYFKGLGLEKMDLLGANIPSVALYKSKFGAELESYTIVTYRKFYVLHLISTISRNCLKFMLKSLRIINK